jgi:hypothetical protein
MRIDSRLMKTDIQVDSIERVDDRLLIKSPPDDWNATKVYLSPQDLVKTVQVSIHRGMVGYLLLFPFFYVAHYLRRERNVDKVVYDVGYVAAAIFMMLLLVGGTTFLLADPISGAMVLGVLAVLFLFIAIGGTKPGFLYLSLPLIVVAFFLLALGQGVVVRDFPKLAMGITLSLLVLGKGLGSRHQEQAARPLYFTGYLLTLIFTAYIAFNAGIYTQENPWGAGIPLLSFALYYFVRYFDTSEVFFHYAAELLLAGGFLLILYGVPLLPTAFYGLPLVLLSMGIILIADRYHEGHGLGQVAPAYIVAILIALLAFAYAWKDQTALLLTLALFSVHFFGGTHSLGIKSTANNLGEKVFQWSEFGLANIAAGLAALLMLTLSRTNWAAIIAAVVYIYFYRKMAFGREPTVLKTRNQYLWAAGGFYTLLIFVILGFLDPLRSTQNDMLLVPLLVLPLLLYARYLEKREMAGPSASLYESSLLAVIASIFLPSLLGDFQPGMAFLVAGLFLALYASLGFLWRNELLYYALPILAAHLYDSTLRILGIQNANVGLLFLPPGLLAMVLAFFFLRRGSGPARTFFLAWFIFTTASLLGVLSDHMLTICLVAGWAALYVLTATLIEGGVFQWRRTAGQPDSSQMMSKRDSYV